MKIFTELKQDKSLSQPIAVVLGNFDGVHLGHQKVIRQARKQADQKGLKLAVVTFEPHPRQYFLPHGKDFRLTNHRDKRNIMADLDVDFLFELPFNNRLAQMEPIEFVDEILYEKLKAKLVITGYNFHFGKNRKGDCEMLKDVSQKYGFSYICIPAVQYEGENISSSLIREKLEEGKIEYANQLLGRAFKLQGEVIHGRALGRTIGCRTANIIPKDYQLPHFGVYAGKARIEGEDIYRNAIVNIGHRPTVQGKRIQTEIHILDWDGDIYGKNLEIELYHFIRPETQFENIDILKDQIQRDIEEARAKLQ